MSLHALRAGHHVKIGPTVFLIVQRLPEGRWQLQNTVTGEWCTLDSEIFSISSPETSYRLL